MADLVTQVNLVLCIVIVLYGCWSYSKSKHLITKYITIAFALFGVSHLINVLGLAAGMETALLAIRSLAYLTVLYAFFEDVHLKKK